MNELINEWNVIDWCRFFFCLTEQNFEKEYLWWIDGGTDEPRDKRTEGRPDGQVQRCISLSVYYSIGPSFHQSLGLSVHGVDPLVCHVCQSIGLSFHRSVKRYQFWILAFKWYFKSFFDVKSMWQYRALLAILPLPDRRQSRDCCCRFNLFSFLDSPSRQMWFWSCWDNHLSRHANAITA